jgi:putative membrane protein
LIRKHIVGGIAALGLCLAGVGCTSMGTVSDDSPLNASEQKFMMMVAQNSNAEVVAGKLATRKATNPQVKQFAQRMVDEHTKMNQEMEALAETKGLALPTAPDEQHSQEITIFEQMSGAEFDRAYMSAQVADHAKAVAMFQDQAKTAADPDLRSFAAKHAPMMRDHLNTTSQISQSLGNAPLSGMGVGRESNGAMSN